MKLPPSCDENNNPAYKLFWETIANPCNKGFAINRWSMFGHGNRSIYLNSYSIDPLAIGESFLELVKPFDKLCEFMFWKFPYCCLELCNVDGN
ncbi:MAG: hypothetical protein WCD53_18650 [Microcoleus sp.]